MNIERTIKKIIFKFLDPKKYKIFIFGSRATGKAKKFSDYDVGIVGKVSIPLSTMAFIKEAFEESSLPFKIDVVDFSLTSNNFKKVAKLKIKQL